MTIKISEEELLHMPHDLLRRLQEYLRERRALADDDTLPVRLPALENHKSNIWNYDLAHITLSDFAGRNGKHRGVLVEQFDRAYVARKWRVTDKVKEIVQLAAKHGWVCLWRYGHPRDEYFMGNPEDQTGSPHIGFSRNSSERWLFCLGQEAGPPNVNLITVQRTENEAHIREIFGTEPLDKDEPLRPGQWKKEMRGGKNLFIHPNDLEMVLTKIKKRKP